MSFAYAGCWPQRCITRTRAKRPDSFSTGRVRPRMSHFRTGITFCGHGQHLRSVFCRRKRRLVPRAEGAGAGEKKKKVPRSRGNFFTEAPVLAKSSFLPTTAALPSFTSDSEPPGQEENTTVSRAEHCQLHSSPLGRTRDSSANGDGTQSSWQRPNDLLRHQSNLSAGRSPPVPEHSSHRLLESNCVGHSPLARATRA